MNNETTHAKKSSFNIFKVLLNGFLLSILITILSLFSPQIINLINSIPQLFIWIILLIITLLIYFITYYIGNFLNSFLMFLGISLLTLFSTINPLSSIGTEQEPSLGVKLLFFLAVMLIVITPGLIIYLFFYNPPSLSRRIRIIAFVLSNIIGLIHIYYKRNELDTFTKRISFLVDVDTLPQLFLIIFLRDV